MLLEWQNSAVKLSLNSKSFIIDSAMNPNQFLYLLTDLTPDPVNNWSQFNSIYSSFKASDKNMISINIIQRHIQPNRQECFNGMSVLLWLFLHITYDTSHM